ncbi:MAG: DUF4388 domain-containing protein [Cyanobacteria bacterium SZAS TMP-1]|nr:DUF4388 domain-containing protein [Cyanobacteria bacterium SZAS TMP-1]
MFKPNSNRAQPPSANKPQESATGGGPARLPRLWNEPSLEDIQNMLARAKKNNGNIVEQPFSITGQDSLFQVSVILPEDSDPIWKFERGTLAGLSEVWSLPSIDVQLIQNLVISECTGQQSVDLISATSGMSRSSTGNLSLGLAEVAEAQAETPKPSATSEMQKLLADQKEVKPKSSSVSLEGDLEKLQLAAVLQSLALTKVTGRLELSGVNGGAEIYVVEGSPTHATTGDTVGDNALIELLAWQSGKFRLMENERATATTIKKRLESLLMEGVALLDQHNFLKSLGLNLDTYLVQAYPNLSEMQFEQTVRRGPQVNMQTLKDLYLEIDGYTSLYDLLRRLPLAKAEWVPLLFNLTQVGLITLATEPPQQAKVVETRVAPDVKLDETGIQAALRPMQRAETEVFTYPLLQYFVKQELARFEVDSKPFALIVFDLYMQKENNLVPMPLSMVKSALQRVREMIRDIDTIGHYETLDYGLILPQTTGRSATIVAQRVAEKLKSTPLPGVGAHSVNVAFGIAAVPQDTKSPGGLMLAAAEAKKNARKNNLMIVEYKTMT